MEDKKPITNKGFDQKAPTDLAVPNEFKIGNQLLNRATLIAQRDIDTKHKITGLDDTAGYKKAVELRAVYRTTRITLEKVRKEMSLPHQNYVKKLKEATDELGAEASKGDVKHINIGQSAIDKVGNHHGLKWAIIKT